ncbi:MAG: hypothetical protein M0003_16650 [Acidithiobacillus sp.]|nr:hypothetical protein [Acidithiobacillus sp.]
MNARDIAFRKTQRNVARRAYAEWGDNDAHGAGNGPWSHFGDDR